MGKRERPEIQAPGRVQRPRSTGAGAAFLSVAVGSHGHQMVNGGVAAAYDGVTVAVPADTGVRREGRPLIHI